jgi:hypothetical protein
MGFVLKDDFKIKLDASCASAVEMLVNQGLSARVGTHMRMKYPAVIKGKWRIFLLFDLGAGWMCSNMSAINRPHWDWFIAQNIEMMDSSIISGLAFGASMELDSAELISRTLKYICDDPCQIPNAECSEKFECPECISDWDLKQPEKGVVGKTFSHKFSYAPSETEDFPAHWNRFELYRLFGSPDFEKFE